MTGAITFDFHNTIANSDAWFHVEVHDLIGAYLRWRAALDGSTASPYLIAEGNALYRTLRQAIHHHGHEMTTEESIDLVLRRLGVVEPRARLEDGSAAIMRATVDQAEPVPGVVETIVSLADAGVPLGIVSSAIHHDFLGWTLERFGLTGRFASVVTSASAGYYKTRPEIYWTALRGLDADPRRSVHIGDSFRFDVIGGRRAGMRTVWFRRGDAAPPAGALPADRTVDGMGNIAGLLLEDLAGAGRG